MQRVARISATHVSRPQAVAMVAAAALLWSTGGFLIKLIDWNAMAINGARSAIALLPLILYVKRPRFTGSAPQVGGAISYAAATITFTAATRLTTAANAIFIQYTAPVHVAILGAWFLKEPVRRRDWLTIALVLTGLLLFFQDDLTLQGTWGIVLAIISSFALAGLIICLRKQKDRAPVETIMLGNVMAFVAGLPFMFWSAPRLEDWTWLGLMGIFQLGLPFVLQTVAITKLTAVEVISIQVLEPIFNPLWALIILGEIPGSWAILGGSLVLTAVTVRGLLMARTLEK